VSYEFAACIVAGEVMTNSPGDQARIEAAAARWLVRRGATLAAQDDEEFYAWLEVDPRHGEAYDAIARTWEDVGKLKQLAGLVRRRPRTWGARKVAVLALAAAMALLAITFSQLGALAPMESYATGIAQTRVVTLRDGSAITMGADSEIRVRLRDRERRVTLERGQAFFEIAQDIDRPFYVQAGGSLIRVLGTKFDVHMGAEGVRIGVQEGRVEVRDAQALTIAPPALRELVSGQETEVVDRPIYLAMAAVPPPVAPATMVQPGAWRTGRLAYNDARLAEVVSDINRYYGPGVRLVGPETDDIRVTAAFRVDEIPAFLDALAATVPVEVVKAEDGAYALRAAN
jgi:transmembrane sensor